MTAPVIALLFAAWLAMWIVAGVVETLVKRRMLTPGEAALIGVAWIPLTAFAALSAVVGVVMAAATCLSYVVLRVTRRTSR